MKKYFKIVLFCATVAVGLPACSGNAGHDGHMSLEGSSDPANTGGKLSGEHAADASDTLHVNDTVNHNR